MIEDLLPRLMEPETLHTMEPRPDVLVVDLCRASVYQELHVPGAVFLDYGRIVADRRPVAGLLPEVGALTEVFSELGIDEDVHVIAYDDEGGGKAGRLLWTLDALGHSRWSLLNGGIQAWANEGHPRSKTPTLPNRREFIARPDPACMADAEWLRGRLGAPDLGLWDARSSAEYHGERRFAMRGGHIPGAANLDWSEVMDRTRNLRLRPEAEVRSLLEGLGLSPDKEIVTYCQTHHRSSLAYTLLRILGYPRVRGYPGSWSDWGNRMDLPVSG